MIEKANIPEGRVGDFSIEHFEIKRDDAIVALFSYRNRVPGPGKYTKLVENGMCWMSDTYAELRDHHEPVLKARGHCLVTGLGLGIVANAMARRDAVTRVTVIERAPEVIALVKDHLHEKVDVIRADATEWKPPRRDVVLYGGSDSCDKTEFAHIGLAPAPQYWPEWFGAVWHDIWPSICSDNLEIMTKLKRRYGRRARWQGC